jgi:hypothetical protein
MIAHLSGRLRCDPARAEKASHGNSLPAPPFKHHEKAAI